MFEWIRTAIADFFSHSSHESTHDSGWSPELWSNDSFHTDTSEPNFQNAWNTGAEFIVPSEADSSYPMFDYTEITFGPGPGSSDDFSFSSNDWDW